MKKILLIDDSDTYIWNLRKYLQRRGYPVKTASTLNEARAAIQEEMLFSLGRKELVRMRDEDPACEVVCHFCHSKYQYDLNDLLAEYDAQAAERAAAEQGT